MNEYKFYRISPISERSTIAINSGQVAREAKLYKTFVNTITQEKFTTTDLAINKSRKKKMFTLFFDTYCSLYLKKKVSILTGVVNLNVYPKIGNFVSDFKKKLKRKNIKVYGYIWCRDFEEEQWQEHIHFYIAISRISNKKMKELFCRKKHTDYNFTFPKKTLKAAVEYLIKKELFAPRKKRTFSKSRFFLKPKKQ